MALIPYIAVKPIINEAVIDKKINPTKHKQLTIISTMFIFPFKFNNILNGSIKHVVNIDVITAVFTIFVIDLNGFSFLEHCFI